ncbi:MAG: molybdenum cofactor guanylyltransferase [Terracidiphilus sp.]
MSLPRTGTDNATADGFILAGGRSTRMGQDKSLIPLAGIPLVQHALTILRSAGFEPRIAGAINDLSVFAPTLPDDPSPSGLGPLAGICSALASSAAQFAVFLPIDLPLLPACLIDYLFHRAIVTESAITAVSIAGFIQTFPVVVHRAGLPILQSSLRSSDRNCLRAFRAAADALARPFSIQPLEMLVQSGQVSHPQGFPVTDWFLNLNSPRDLERAETLLAQKHLQVS